MSKTFTFNTGRVYDGEQNLILTINPTTVPADDYDLYYADITFEDSSRNISGLLKGMALFANDTPQEVGRAVLRAYDRCNYETI